MRLLDDRPEGYPLAVTSRSGVTDGPRMPSRASGLLYGLGLGGFVDGIVLHQILQWHHMVSDVDGIPQTRLRASR